MAGGRATGAPDGDPGRTGVFKGYQHLEQSNPENRPIEIIGEFGVSSNLKCQPENENPGALAGATGAERHVIGITSTEYRMRAEWASALVFALGECHPDDAAQICAAFLADMQTGGPRVALFDDCRGDAAIWAEVAPPHELEAYALAALARLGEMSKGLILRKRLMAAIWDSFTDADRVAFARAVGAIRGAA